ncbi:tol-pal system protein YbgF [Desulfobacula toluolica]|uniref:Predicted tetratricopeptide domain protein n=1 Tax=Desulfobacula toluolica (strain DSM 7467 / Tol2) TaxID=651182 RepID=K0NIJ7_DESTT|nr:tol-pal system protein YbgF [Desulfobacula toluolica]CCK79603.1 predicted tetratricopeptide domain protein [Desulfobacula toluolica Tol2]
MPCLKKRLYKPVYFLILSFFFVSCGAMHSVKTPAGNDKEETLCHTKLVELESELTGIKQDQATLKYQIEKNNTIIQTLQDIISTLETKIAFLEKTPQPAAPIQYKIEALKPADLYKKARNLLLENNFSKAAGLFSEFIKHYPQNSLADNCVYWLGECHYSLKDYKKAIEVFKDLEIKYPKSEKVPDAILKTGYSYLLLDDFNRANHYLKQVLKQYPFSPAAEKAQKKLGDFE